MNTSVVHSSGALLLEPINQLVLGVKMVNSEEVIPITAHTPQKELQGMYICVHSRGKVSVLVCVCGQKQNLKATLAADSSTLHFTG